MIQEALAAQEQKRLKQLQIQQKHQELHGTSPPRTMTHTVLHAKAGKSTSKQTSKTAAMLSPSLSAYPVLPDIAR